MWLFVTECLLAILLVVIACRTRRYWCGGLLLLALCIGTAGIKRVCTGTDVCAPMYMVPFVFGLTAIVVARGRFVARSLSQTERERRNEEAVKIYGPSPLTALIFGILSVLVALAMSSAWTVVDLDGTRVRVERRSWWGMRVKEKEFPQSAVAKVEVMKRERRTIRGGTLHFDALVFRRSDGMVLGTTRGGSWGFDVEDDAKALSLEIQKGGDGRFHKCSFVLVGPSAPFLMAFLLLTILFGRGLVRPRESKTPTFTRSTPGGISLANVLKRASP